jgi:hypothetical protein
VPPGPPPTAQAGLEVGLGGAPLFKIIMITLISLGTRLRQHLAHTPRFFAPPVPAMRAQLAPDCCRLDAVPEAARSPRSACGRWPVVFFCLPSPARVLAGCGRASQALSRRRPAEEIAQPLLGHPAGAVIGIAPGEMSAMLDRGDPGRPSSAHRVDHF